MKSTTRYWIQKVAVLLVLIRAFYLSTIRPGESESLGDDFAMYIHEAKNIALGVDYRQTDIFTKKNMPNSGRKRIRLYSPCCSPGCTKLSD
jgi:hypothetical protein